MRGGTVLGTIGAAIAMAPTAWVQEEAMRWGHSVVADGVSRGESIRTTGSTAPPKGLQGPSRQPNSRKMPQRLSR
jgi:hypothetical protein